MNRVVTPSLYDAAVPLDNQDRGDAAGQAVYRAGRPLTGPSPRREAGGGSANHPDRQPGIPALLGQGGCQYLLVCLECSEGSDALILPFDSAEARGKWAAAHTKETGHDRWYVEDEER